MSETLTFDRVHLYSTLKPGISLTVVLRHGDSAVECEAKLDTGSSHCIFKRSHGELLGIDIEAEASMWIATVTGRFEAHPHTVSIEVLGIKTESVVYFAADEMVSRSVLGRTGWLDRVQIGLIDYEGKLLLGDYLSPSS